jgi:hypothetical protein
MHSIVALIMDALQCNTMTWQILVTITQEVLHVARIVASMPVVRQRYLVTTTAPARPKGSNPQKKFRCNYY